ncbi:MAG: hypothetical protein NWR72_06025 [Bacteroidia bacterium]|nr:hypothetical protein [Bacteroidia bacterium]
MHLRHLLLLLCTLPHFVMAQRAIQPDHNINSPYEEREPILSPDGKTLYFWRRECPDNTGGFNDPGDIWYSEKDAQGRWMPAQRFGNPLNSKGHDFVWGVSAKGDSLFLMQAAPGVQEPGISYSTKARGSSRWAAPEPMHIRRFRYGGNYKDYFRTRQNFLLLPNEGYPSFGGTDLYICFPINDTAWSKPINLGQDVNSSGNEDAPFLAADGKTLYFNSDGYNGRGDHDVYVSYRLDDSWQRWTKPEPLPPPINSKGYDFDFQLSADGKTAFWCSNLGTMGSNDIFYMDLAPCQLDVYPGGDLTRCLGESVNLEAAFSPTPNVEYQWFKNGAPIRGAYNSSLRVDQDGDYQLQKKMAGCEVKSSVQRVRFVQPPSASVRAGGEVICLEDSVLLQALSTSGNTYQWIKNGLSIPEATGRDHWASTPGTYSVEVAEGGCSSRSSSYDLLSFNPPIIFTEEDTMEGWMPILPRWDWTNKVRPDKGETVVRDLVAGPLGETYVLTQTSNRGKVTQRVSSFFSNGLERGITYETDVRSTAPAFMATDPDGNLIVAGHDEYLRKFKPDGRVMWWKDERRQQMMGVCSDPLGNIYTAGRYRDTLSLGSERRGAPDRGAIFLAKHSPRGELLWLKTFSADFYDFDFGNALSSDCEGNIYLAGGFDLVADFDRFALRGTLLKDNYFLVKFNPEGRVLFGQKIVTDRSRVKSGDLYVDCDGRSTLLINREYHTFAENGIDMWHGLLLQPEGSYALIHRVVSYQGDVYASGFTMDGRSFVSKLNRMYNQIILWQDRGASTTEQDLAAITVDANGAVTVSGVSRGNNFQGSQFDLTSGSPVFLMKYARPMVESITREPLTLCGGDPVVLLVREERGLSYQWLRDGREISGATQQAYRANRAGTYQVRGVVSGCERVSEPVLVTECGEDPVLQSPILATRATEPEAPKPVLSTDVDYGFGGEPNRLRGRRVNSQEEMTISSTEAMLLVWDHGAVDLDTVSINLNGEWILENYGLQKEALQIPVTLRTGDNYLVLYALNLGGTPPNTASIKVDDGITKQTMQLRSSLRNCGMLRIRVKP